MGDAIAGVVEWGLGLFAGFKQELDNVGVSQPALPASTLYRSLDLQAASLPGAADCEWWIEAPQLANPGLSPAASASRVAPDMKLLHTHQHEERLRAMARYGDGGVRTSISFL